jgi:hypothetical protein
MPIQPSPSPAPIHPAYAVEDSAATVKAAKPIALNMCDSFIRVGSLLCKCFAGLEGVIIGGLERSMDDHEAPRLLRRELANRLKIKAKAALLQ